MTASTDRAPATLRWAVGLLFAQCVVVTALTGYVVYLDARGRFANLGNALIVTGFAVIMAILLGLFGWGLWRRRGWARGPALFLELMLLPIGYFMISAGVLWAGVPVLVIALAGAGLLVTPSARQALGLR